MEALVRKTAQATTVSSNRLLSGANVFEDTDIVKGKGMRVDIRSYQRLELNAFSLQVKE